MPGFLHTSFIFSALFLGAAVLISREGDELEQNSAIGASTAATKVEHKHRKVKTKAAKARVNEAAKIEEKVEQEVERRLKAQAVEVAKKEVDREQDMKDLVQGIAALSRKFEKESTKIEQEVSRRVRKQVHEAVKEEVEKHTESTQEIQSVKDAIEVMAEKIDDLAAADQAPSDSSALIETQETKNDKAAQDEGASKKAVEKEVAEVLETRMKFFPGMTQISQLLEWNATIAGPRMGPAKNLEPLPQGRGRIMSMHDMAGGYQEIADNDYLQMFKSWNVVDLFVYFSHVRMSVPPLQWTAVAHEHGRPALGTIIFEENAESADAIRAIRQNRDKVLSKLVEVADHYGFDGFLFNNEAPYGVWNQGEPESFVKDLKDGLKKKLGERAQVISYPYGPQDSMFQVSDGVMVNYNWPASRLDHVRKAAGDRSADVYMGMDAFGEDRNNNVPDPKSVRSCGEQNLSLGIFAPGWTFEHPAKRTYSLLAVDYDHDYWNSIAKNFGRQDATGGGEWPVQWPKQHHS